MQEGSNVIAVMANRPQVRLVISPRVVATRIIIIAVIVEAHAVVFATGVAVAASAKARVVVAIVNVGDGVATSTTCTSSSRNGDKLLQSYGYYVYGWLLIVLLFHFCYSSLSLFNDYFLSIHDIDAGTCGLARQATAVEQIPLGFVALERLVAVDSNDGSRRVIAEV